MRHAAANVRRGLSRLDGCLARAAKRRGAGAINIIRIVAPTRKKAGKALDAFAIVTPNLGQNKKPAPIGHPFQGLDDDTDTQLRQTGASITMLPDFARRESYWNPLPPATPKTFIQYVLSNWSDALVAKSAANPARWRFLFFYEMAVSILPSKRSSRHETKPGGDKACRCF